MLTTEEKSQKRKETILNRNILAILFLVFVVAIFSILRWGIIDIPTNAINEALIPELQRYSNHETYRYLFFVDQPQMGDNNSPVYAVAKDHPDKYFLITMLVDEKLPSMHRAIHDRSACYAEIPISKTSLQSLTPDQAIQMISPCNMEITTTLYDSQFGFSNGYIYFNNTISEITK